MAEKLTYAKALNTVMNILADAEIDIDEAVVDKLVALRTSLEKKNASPKKLTAQQQKNEGLKEVIIEFLTDHEGEGFTVTDLLKAIPELEGDSNQHVSALLRQLCQATVVEKYSEKRRTYFRIAE